MQKELRVTDFISEIKRLENYPFFEKLAHVIQHILNIKGKSTEASDRSHIL